MKAHPISEIFPLMGDVDLAELAEDIKTHGLREPVVTYEGMILDGRNRWAACELAGIRPVPAVKYDGDDPVGFVVSRNLRRRHLTVSFRAMLANDLAKLQPGRRTDLRPPANLPEVGQARAAELLNVSERTVRAAKTVADKGTPAEVARVRAGEETVSRAEKILREKERDIRAAAAMDPNRFGDLAQRLDAGEKVDPVHRVLRKREAAGTRKGDVLLDGTGLPVPDHLRDLFATPFLRDLSMMAESLVRDGVVKIYSKVKDNGHQFKWLLLGKIMKALESAKADLEVVWSHLSEAIPHAVCPKCKGASSVTDDAPNCDACRSTGYVTKWRWVELRDWGFQ
jgi:ParB-like chromosome segregation protein Spo0J